MSQKPPQRKPVKKGDPDPNDYRSAEGEFEVGFTRNPVAGGAIPGRSDTDDIVNGVDFETEDDAESESEEREPEPERQERQAGKNQGTRPEKAEGRG